VRFGPWGDLVGGIASERDEVGYLIGIDAVAFPHLGGTDARHLASAHREENGRPFRGQMEGVAVSACYQHRSATLFLLRRCRREKVICS